MSDFEYYREERGRRYVVWGLIAVVFVITIIYCLYTWLSWDILETMYLRKAGIDWFSTVFYHNYIFIISSIIALVVINPIPRRSDLLGLINSIRRYFYELTGIQFVGIEIFQFKGGVILWGLWQFIKWGIAFLLIFSSNSIPGAENISLLFYMMSKGIGNWSDVLRIFILPIRPVSADTLIKLIPTMEVEYRIIHGILTTVVIIVIIRLILRSLREFFEGFTSVVGRNVFIILSLIMFLVIIDAPYWAMDITTPYEYSILIILLVIFVVLSIYFHMGGFQMHIRLMRGRRIVIHTVILLLTILLFINLGVIVYFKFNWNNRWLEYEWYPLTYKRIKVTCWAAGTNHIVRHYISNVPRGNISKILDLVRQWDRSASYVKMKNQIGVNWMSLSSSDIIYVNGREYWSAPTTIRYPSTDWISTHLIYTHASKIILIDSHTGDLVPISEAFGVKREPLIYYGKGEGFNTEVYVHVKGYHEIGNVTYPGDADYVLSDWKRSLWFLLNGQIGFAFWPPQDKIDMLYKRNVLDRVRGILIPGLHVDPDAYIVTDGKRVYYAVQVFIDYPLHTKFSASDYLRLFAVVLVDVENGHMKGYIVGKPDNFLVDFYRDYYSSWSTNIPNWLILQLRYPEALLGTPAYPGQLDVDFIYHVKDPFVWRSGSQFFERPPGTEVHYILITIGNKVYFVGIQLVEFLGSEGKNLAGMYIAYGGSKLGTIELYSVQNITKTYIGPSAALQALETDNYVRKQLTLLTNPRTGNILLYPIGSKLYYFIPVYVTIQSPSAVITKMAFIGIVDAATGTNVAIGNDSVQAYYKLVGQYLVHKLSFEEKLNRVLDYIKSEKYQILNPTKINANVEIKIGSTSYLSSNDWLNVKKLLDVFINEYAKKYDVSIIYYWKTGGEVNLGILVNIKGIVELFYISISF